MQCIYFLVAVLLNSWLQIIANANNNKFLCYDVSCLLANGHLNWQPNVVTFSFVLWNVESVVDANFCLQERQWVHLQNTTLVDTMTKSTLKLWLMRTKIINHAITKLIVQQPSSTILLQSRVRINVGHLLHVCQRTGMPAPVSWPHPPNGQLAGRWRSTDAEYLCHQLWTSLWNHSHIVMCIFC